MSAQTAVYVFPYLPDSSETTTNCYTFGCMLISQKFYLNVRNIVAVSICATGTLLFYVFYKKSKKLNAQNSKYTKNNKLVLYTIGSALIFDFLPHFAVFCSFTVNFFSTIFPNILLIFAF
uniref:Vomeronasal type-1 receptor n=1 Tax=Panagrolaimus superbus TaxID=310955 RepID=A0A914ZBN4_9BILA